MASSDDEAEIEPESVSNYHFVDERDEPISFSVLPIQWNEHESTGGDKRHIFLHGFADNGLQKIHKHAIAWKFDLTNVIPDMLVLSKEKHWIKLQKPRKSFEEICRTILITVHCLSYAKRNPEATGKSVWDYLSRVFSSYEVRPSQNDLVDHMELITEALKRDDVLAKSKFLVAFLEEKPRKMKLFDEVVQLTAMSGFIVDDTEDYMFHDAVEDESKEEDELFDSVCSFCDNGGELLCCEGRCLRSFHATVEDGEESECVSLNLTKDEVEAMQNFFCKNCEYKQHQCFACGKLGSSDKASRAEVFPCVSATCGHFYHPRCVSKLLFRDDEVAADQLQEKITAGESFTCPLHKCYVCKQGENKADSNLQFAVCRRCPKAYHRKCLPRKIAFEDKEEEGIITRAWEGLLPNHRILIYCLKHEINDELGTPIRDHITFPGVEEKKSVVERPRKKQASAIPAGKRKVVSKHSSLTSEAASRGKFSVKALKRMPSDLELVETSRKSERVPAVTDSSKKVKATDVSRKFLKENVKSRSVEVDRSSLSDTKKTTLGDRLFAYVTQGNEQIKPGKRDTADSENNKTLTTEPPRKKLNSELPSLDADSEWRLLSLMKDAASSVSVEDIVKKHKIPSTHAYSSKSVVDKAITFGKVEGSVEAIRTALKKLEEDGSSIEDAKAVCEPEVLNQIFKWKNKLKVYLAPFLHGMRYTSFGRHFTKVEKLQEVVEKLHWYVKDGDMIVDFCCGANDFSCLMKKKLDETGKKCLYKNYDILQAKNDFNFEKRDWMTVEPKELAAGSQLIMGLNPPFGVKAALANKFIKKALEFNPKLLILIVPPETERLDCKKPPYELVWEDDQFLSGKSFYLPGSIDENDKQMDQWNLTAPPLYLWSRCDWAPQHKAIAQKHGHISRQEGTQMESNCNETHALDPPMEADHGDYGDISMLVDLPLQNNEATELGEIGVDHEEGMPETVGERGGESNHTHGNSQSNKVSSKSKKKRCGKGTLGRGISGKSPSDKQNGGRHLVGFSNSENKNSDDKGMPQSTLANVIDGKSSFKDHSSKSTEMPSHDGYQGDRIPHCSPPNAPNVRSPLLGQSSKSIEIPSLSGFGDGMCHRSPANVIDGRSSLEGLSTKSIEMHAHTGFNDNVHQHFGDKGMAHCYPANTVIGRSSLEGHPFKSMEMPSHTGFGDGYQHFEPTICGSRRPFGAAYDENQTAIPGDMGRYSMSNNEPYSSLTYGFSIGANMEDQYAGHVRNTESHFYRPYMGSQVPLYGQHLVGSFTPGFGQMGSLPSNSAAEASYRMSTSTMDRYAPRLDELNPTRMSAFRSEPSMLTTSNFYGTRAPQPGYPSNIGFTPSLNNPFPYQGSGGWLDD
ncbi:protein ENHANCED DOWNY MILDEW 2-like [Melia azedarach]|uniref:Protein ENHANCED DOWNY MILDEW 2-like n=1 Tax=Melia azedarach TaxID=155640 RepID=A0ACC1YPX1_MELAZ|nr:protein ENHANCED DOWNY MILDEW 2-like [Melia azedarach]